MADKWSRDPGIRDIIEFFDQPEYCAWHLLRDKEAATLHEEIRKCNDPDTGFEYMARNYYWITTKDGSDTLMRLKETQEMLLETIKMLRARGHGVKIMIIKARQLYISTFVEAYLAWLTQTNPNNRGLVVSYDETHAGKLFGIILHIYDQLPWWLRPMIGARKYEEGIHLINPDHSLRSINPGLNSRISVQSAKQNVGVAEGETINGAHLSEFGSWDPVKARKIIIGDFRWALPDAANTFAILETRVRQASKFAERLWESQADLGDRADWYPFFLPIYFDKSHFIAPRAGWKPEKPELDVKARAAEEWCACTVCGHIRPIMFGGESIIGTSCASCKKGTFTAYVLQDGQMNWLYQRRLNAQTLGEEAVVEMQQSLATNPQEAFASVTETIFSKQARDWVAATTRSGYLARGYMSSDGKFHAPRRARGYQDEKGWVDGPETPICWHQGCRQDHSGETERYLTVWQLPQPGAKYWMSVDVASGQGGSHDYSVINITKTAKLPDPDIQVGAYRCNTISAWHFADVVNYIGRWYNNALAIVDYTNYQSTGDRLLNYFKYPNIYQWLNPDQINQTSNRWHWVWNSKNKEGGWSVLDGWLRDHSYIVKDPILAKELRHFQRLSDGSMGAPDSKEDDGLGTAFERIHDDTVMASIQGIIAAHQQDPRRGDSPGAPQQDGVRGPGDWEGSCKKCGKKFSAQAPCERDRCPYCGSVWLGWAMISPEAVTGVGKNAILGFKWEDMIGTSGKGKERSPVTEEFSFGPGGHDGTF